MHQDAEAPVAFGRFSVLPSRRELLANGRRVELGERAFDVLLALVEARGTVVSRTNSSTGSGRGRWSRKTTSRLRFNAAQSARAGP
jgi:DNA-binding response OmpR family regulator